MNFKELMTKKFTYNECLDCGIINCINPNHTPFCMETISVRDLGNFFWKNFLELNENPLYWIDESKPEWTKQLLKRIQMHDLAYRNCLYLELAIECLGEKEIERRLKECDKK